MTDITTTDPYAPKRLGNGRARVPFRAEDVEHINEEIRERHGMQLVPVEQPPPPPREPTWLEHIAKGVSQLTYGEMKDFAAGVLGDDAKPEDVIALADKFHEWAKAKVPA